MDAAEPPPQPGNRNGVHNVVTVESKRDIKRARLEDHHDQVLPSLSNGSFDNLLPFNPVNDDSYSFIDPVMDPSSSPVPTDMAMPRYRANHSPQRTDIAIPHLRSHESPPQQYPVSPIQLPQSRSQQPQYGSMPPRPPQLYMGPLPNYIPPPAQYYPMQPPNPYHVLQAARQHMEDFTYLLPCLRQMGEIAVNIRPFGPIRHYTNPNSQHMMAQKDLQDGKRRVETAVCAFGGTLRAQNINAHTRSIFRVKQDTPARRQYRQEIANRYKIGSNISWEVEEEPPVPTYGEDTPFQRLYQHKSSTDEADSASTGTTVVSNKKESDSDEFKSKYRCKKCGQLKQNHSCPFRSSLQRSIGVMVYPAVNSYTAAEPGEIAPALTKMNNFVSYDSDSTTTTATKSPTGSPGSSFVASVHLGAEHYRVISEKEDYSEYPAIPLTDSERKKWSDTLFMMTQRVDGLTKQVGDILRTARDDWDMAVAELLTQVVVALYCHEGDRTLEGLRFYLLRLGISC